MSGGQSRHVFKESHFYLKSPCLIRYKEPSFSSVTNQKSQVFNLYLPHFNLTHKELAWFSGWYSLGSVVGFSNLLYIGEERVMSALLPVFQIIGIAGFGLLAVLVVSLVLFCSALFSR